MRYDDDDDDDDDISLPPIISVPIHPICTKFGIHIPCMNLQAYIQFFFEIRIINAKMSYYKLL